jgi:hypothetical protein
MHDFLFAGWTAWLKTRTRGPPLPGRLWQRPAPPVAYSAAPSLRAANRLRSHAPKPPRTARDAAPAIWLFAWPAVVRTSAVTWRWHPDARWIGAGFVAATERLAAGIPPYGIDGSGYGCPGAPPPAAGGRAWCATCVGTGAQGRRRWQRASVLSGTSRRRSWTIATWTLVRPGRVTE